MKGSKMAKAKAKAAGTLRLEDFPEWQEMQARGARIAADLREAEGEFQAARDEWAAGTKEIERADLRRYFAGEITARELGAASLDGVQERMESARKRIRSLQDARSKHEQEERALRARLTIEAARKAFPEYAEMERRILRASAELLDAVREKRALEEGLHARGFWGADTQLRALLVGELGEMDPVKMAKAIHDLQPGFLGPFRSGDVGNSGAVGRYLSLASKALGESLPGVH